MSQEEGQGFLSRWSRRKAQVQQDAAPAPSSAAALSTTTASASASASASAAVNAAASPVHSETEAPAESVAEAAPRPTLQDVEQLDAQSDYRQFVARDVDPEVRNAAFKKLFHSDPHFNVMDGLDVYIDDYNTPNPLPVAIMKTLVQARAMGLIDDELKEQEPPSPDPVGVQAESAATQEQAPGPGEDVQGAESSIPNTAEATSPTDALPEAEPVIVECVLVPDRASNDEPISLEFSEQVPAAAAAEGTVVPFPRRPGIADPA